MKAIQSRAGLAKAAVIFALLAACSEAPSTVPTAPLQPSRAPRTAPVPTASPSTQATLAVTDASGATGPFRISSLARLSLEVAYRGTPGPHAVRLDVASPAGTLYAQLHGNLLAGPDGRGASRHGLEVSGTPIETYRMTGTWQFSIVVDGLPLASAAIAVTDQAG